VTEAWIVRDMERQELRQKLMREAEAWEETEENRGRFLLRLAEAIAALLVHKSEMRVPPTRASAFLFGKVTPEIESFARSEAEYWAILAMFLEKDVLPSALSSYYAELQRQEIEEPEVIFRAPSAMSEVPPEG